MSNYRDRQLLDLAHKIKDCTLQLPGICEGHSYRGCEPAHANSSRYGKGMSIKAHDCFFAAGCHSCHAELDQGKRFSKEEKLDFWQRAYERTMLICFQNGWLKVVP